MDKTKNWFMDLREIFFHFFRRKRLGLRWRRRGVQLSLVQSIVLVQAKRRNQGMDYLYGTFVCNSCKESMDLLVRKPS